MKIDLCELFGVEEGEEFCIDYEENYVNLNSKYKIENNELFISPLNEDNFELSGVYMPLVFNNLLSLNKAKKVIKLPKRKEFTDDELCILRNIDKEYKWIARDENDKGMFAYEFKPIKGSYSWIDGGNSASIYGFNHLFQNIQWEDEEPVFIDDYVER